MLWGRSARVFDKYSNIMNTKDSNLREKLKQAIEEQSDQSLQDELFSKLESYEVDKQKKTN